MSAVETTPAPRTTSCGCCTGGCVCWNHRDEPRGIPVRVCAYHSDPAHPHPRETSPIATKWRCITCGDALPHGGWSNCPKPECRAQLDASRDRVSRAPGKKTWVCDECGTLYTPTQAARAMRKGCAAGCSGLDVRENIGV